MRQTIDINPQIQEMQQIPSARSMKKTSLRHFIINFFRICDKKKTLKAAREQRNKDKDNSRFFNQK